MAGFLPFLPFTIQLVLSVSFIYFSVAFVPFSVSLSFLLLVFILFFFVFLSFGLFSDVCLLDIRPWGELLYVWLCCHDYPVLSCHVLSANRPRRLILCWAVGAKHDFANGFIIVRN